MICAGINYRAQSIWFNEAEAVTNITEYGNTMTVYDGRIRSGVEYGGSVTLESPLWKSQWQAWRT